MDQELGHLPEVGRVQTAEVRLFPALLPELPEEEILALVRSGKVGELLLGVDQDRGGLAAAGLPQGAAALGYELAQGVLRKVCQSIVKIHWFREVNPVS